MTAPLVVVGDVMLDVDRTGVVDRLSPEAPVPVLHDVAETRRPGGAALAALLAARCTARPVVLIAPFATDAAAQQVRSLLGDAVRVIALPWAGSTPVKTRLRAGGHPIARIDEGGVGGTIGPLPTEISDELDDLLQRAGAVLVADYGGGCTSYGPLRRRLASAAVRLPVLWDPHPRGADPVVGTWWVTPNEAELQALTASPRVVSSPLGGLRARADELSRRWQTRAVCVTLGRRGAMLCTGDGPPLVVAAPEVTAGDTCGAGDSFAAAAAVAFADGKVPSEAVGFAVHTAAQFVACGGAAGLDPASAAPAGPVPRSVTDILAAVRRSGGSVVATGGCFDLLHAGHIATLQAARGLGDCLVVCLNSDRSVRRLKGDTRPLQSQQDRARVLTALECVDAVVIFDDETPCAVLRDLRPDIWAKGGDYSGMTLPEAAVLAEWGGEVVTVPYLPGRSTSALVELAGTAAS